MAVGKPVIYGYYNTCPENSLVDIVFMTVDKEVVRGS